MLSFFLFVLLSGDVVIVQDVYVVTRSEAF